MNNLAHEREAALTSKRQLKRLLKSLKSDLQRAMVQYAEAAMELQDCGERSIALTTIRPGPRNQTLPVAEGQTPSSVSRDPMRNQNPYHNVNSEHERSANERDIHGRNHLPATATEREVQVAQLMGVEENRFNSDTTQESLPDPFREYASEASVINTTQIEEFASSEQRGTFILPNEALALCVRGVSEVVRIPSTYVSGRRPNAARVGSEHLAEDSGEIQKRVSDEEIEMAIQSLERCENEYWALEKELQKHFDTYDTQFKWLWNCHGNYTQRHAKDEFGPLFLQQGSDFSKKLNVAEKNVKKARVEAKNVGVNTTISRDKESGFLSVYGEGPQPNITKFLIDSYDRIGISEWRQTPHISRHLQTSEYHFATSGANVETWESSSTRADINKRRKIDKNGDNEVADHGERVDSMIHSPPRGRKRSKQLRKAVRVRSEGVSRRKPMYDVPRRDTRVG